MHLQTIEAHRIIERQFVLARNGCTDLNKFHRLNIQLLRHYRDHIIGDRQARNRANDTIRQLRSQIYNAQ